MPDINPSKLCFIAAGCMVIMVAAYVCFLTATWVQFQSDRNTRMEKIDELLDRIPRTTAAAGTVLGVRESDVPEGNNPDTV